MYERFISSSMLTGCWLAATISDIEVLDVEGVVFDELPARFDLITHERGEHQVCFGVIFGTHLQQGADGWIHRRFPELLWVHLAETLVAVDRDALLSGGNEIVDDLVER